VTCDAENQGGFLVAEAGGGVLNMSGTAALNISGARGLHVAINGGTGIVNLGGGVLTTPLVQKGTSDGTLNFHGGTLRASAANANYMSGLTAAYVYGEGGTIDTNGNDITIAQPLLAPTGSGISAAGLVVTGSGFIDAPMINITGAGIGATAIGNIDGNGNLTGITITNPGTDYTNDPITFDVIGGGGIGSITGAPTLVANVSGGLTKIGAGTLTLSGASTYAGATNINAGILRASNAAGSATGTGAVNVNTGGTLSGTGTLSGVVTVASSATMSPGDPGSVGTITVGGLTLNAGSILRYEWDPAQNHDLIVVTANNGLTINGGQVNLLNAGGSTVFSSNGVYNLIGFTGNIAGNPSNLSVDPASIVAGKNYIFGASNGFVTLLITPAGVTGNFWNVNADGLWTTGANWTANTAPNALQAFANFGGGGTPITAPRTVTLDANQTVGSLGFNSPQSFTIAGGNTLTLDNGADPATISVTGGSHTIGVAMNAASGGVQFNVTSAADVLTVSGPLAGAANVTKIGAGALTFSAANSYTGTTTLNLGTLTISGAGTLGNAANPLALNGASLNLGGTTQTVGATTISAGAITNGTLAPSSLTYDGTAATTISAGISGSATVTKNGTGTLTLSGNNSHTGGTTLNAGTLVITSNNSFGAATTPVTFNGGTLRIPGTGATDLGTRPLTGFPALIDVVEASHTFSIGQSFDAVVAFVKRGLGRLVLSGNTNFPTGPAPLTVNSGILEIAAGITSDTAAGNSPIQIANEADSTATLTVSGNATLNSGTSEIYVGQGFATANGTLNLRDSGTINVGNWLAVGRSNAVGTVNMSGGTLNKLGGNGTHVTVGANTATSTGSFFQSGGIINSADSDFYVGESGIGTYAISGTAQANLLVLRLGANATGNGTVNLNGGTINAAQVLQGAGFGSLNLNGGTLRPAAPSADFIGATVATNILEGGAIIDTNGVNATVNATLSSAAFPDGGLRKRGAGTLTLTAANSYTGPTVIEAGTLSVTGTIAGSASITVQQNATLDVNPSGMSLANAQTLRGSGTVAGVMRMGAGSKLAPGEGVGTLTFTNDLDIAQAVAPANSAALLYEISSTSDKALLTAGTLTIGTGVLGFGDFAFANAGGIADGTYTLFDSAVAINGTLDAANLSGAIPGGFFGTLAFADNGHDIVLQVVPEPASMALLAAGVASLLGFRRRHRGRAEAEACRGGQ
jgi:autotransporter-associated beta strand protein